MQFNIIPYFFRIYSGYFPCISRFMVLCGMCYLYRTDYTPKKRVREAMEEKYEFLKARPWLKQPKYSKLMPSVVVSMMYEGAHVSEICRELLITRSTFYNYLKNEVEFKAAYELGKVLAEGWHHHSARTNLANENYNPVLWQMIMRNRFGFAEHRLVKLDGFDTADSYTAKMQILNNAVAQGEISPVEFNQLSDGISKQARIEEITELKQIVDTLERKISERK